MKTAYIIDKEKILKKSRKQRIRNESSRFGEIVVGGNFVAKHKGVAKPHNPKWFFHIRMQIFKDGYTS